MHLVLAFSRSFASVRARQIFMLAIAALAYQSVALTQTRVIAAGETLNVYPDEITSEALVVRGSLTLSGKGATESELITSIRVDSGGSVTLSDLTLLAVRADRPALVIGKGGSGAINRVHVARSGSDEPAAPLVDIRGDAVAITRSSFEGAGDLLSLSGNGAKITDCTFDVHGGRGLIVAPAGLARDATVLGCTFQIASAGVGAVVHTPHVSFANCGFAVAAEGASGLRALPLELYRDFVWSSEERSAPTYQRLRFGATDGARGGTALTVREFGGVLTTVDSITIHGFDVGADLAGRHVSLTRAAMRSNEVAVQLDGAAVQGCVVENVVGATAVQLVGSRGGSRVRGLRVSGVGRGIHVAESFAAPCQIIDANFGAHLTPVSLASTVTEGSLYADAPLVAAAPTTAHDAHAHHHHQYHPPGKSEPDAHAHHHTRPTSKAVIVVPSADLRVSQSCTPLTSTDGWTVCPLASTGRLTIATGHGLSDPIHEHTKPLGSVRIDAGGEHSISAVQSAVQESFAELAGAKSYQLALPEIANYHDVYLGWESTAPVRLRLVYPHDQPVVMRALGSVLPVVESPLAVDTASRSCYHVDAHTGAITLALVPDGGPEEVIIYSRDVPVPAIFSETQPVRLVQPVGSSAEAYAVRLEGGEADVSITDMFGASIAAPAHVGRDGHTFDLSSHTAGGGWIFVTTPAGYFKGPLLLPANSNAKNTSTTATEAHPHPGHHHGHH